MKSFNIANERVVFLVTSTAVNSWEVYQLVEWCGEALAKKIRRGIVPDPERLENSSTVKEIARRAARLCRSWGDDVDVEEAEKALDEFGVYEYEQDGQKVINIARSQWVDGLRPATESEKSEILRALKWCRENFSKRLDAYLKRWGTSKLRFGTYWADR